MAYDRDVKRKIFKDLNPYVPIDSNDPRYVALYQAPNDPIARIRDHIDLVRDDQQSHQFLSGSRGSGKSTELKRLKHELESYGYLVISVDVLEYLNPNEPINIDQLLVVLGAAFSERVSAFLGFDPGHSSFPRRFWNFLTKTTVVSDELGVSVPGSGFAANFKAKLKTTATFREKITENLAGRTKELKEALEQFTRECLDLIKAQPEKQWAGFVFIVDSLEQLRDSSLGKSAVMESVERIFSQDRQLLQMERLHVVYTVPPWLPFLSPGVVHSIQMLPCVKLWNHGENERIKSEADWNILRDFIIRRIGEGYMSEVFGEPDEGGLYSLLEKLIENSGGHFRDLLTMAREALLTAPELKLSQPHVDHAISLLRQGYPLSESEALWLKEIDSTHHSCLPDKKPETVGQFTMFLDRHMVLLFRNGKDWYDVHPAIIENVKEIAELVERRKAIKGA